MALFVDARLLRYFPVENTMKIFQHLVVSNHSGFVGVLYLVAILYRLGVKLLVGFGHLVILACPRQRPAKICGIK